MSRTGVGCRVLIDGAQLDDGCIDWTAPPEAAVPQGVVAASGLTVTWGRDTTVDQPVASTCQFQVADDPGGATVLDTITLGAQVDIYADADIPGPATQSAFTDPSFDTEVRGTVRNAVLGRSQVRADEPSGWSAVWDAIDPKATAVVTMPPGSLQIDGTNPLAWMSILATKGGDTWTIRARVYLPQKIALRMRPVAYSGPYASAATVLPYMADASGSAGWQTLQLTFAPGLSQAWVGIQFESSAGLTWGDVPPAQTWAEADAAGTTWGDLSAVYVDRVEVLGPSDAAAASVLVFSGRITDLEGSFDPEWDEPSMMVTATDFLGDLGNRYVGDEPWEMETVPARLARILSLAARPGDPPILVEVAPGFQSRYLTWDDVDHQSAADLISEIAQSVDGVLWSASHSVVGAYIRLEDPTQRLPLYELAMSSGDIIILPIEFDPADPVAPPTISSCEVLRDPVRFLSTVSDIATRVSVGWLAQIVDDEGNPATEDRRVEMVDTVAEIDFGTRAVSVDTLLTNEPDALTVADGMLARLAASWRISGIAVDDAEITVPDDIAARMFVLLLDSTTRGGQPLLLTELPEWSPTGATAPIYLEGGKYTFDGGGWVLELTVSRASGQGKNARWDDIPNDPAWIWDAWDPSITWNDLRGVKGP